jgi:hypothetical protein
MEISRRSFLTSTLARHAARHVQRCLRELNPTLSFGVQEEPPCQEPFLEEKTLPYALANPYKD